MDAIERCVGVPGGEVLDDASETLAIRAEQRATRDALRGMLNETSREMARKNFAERAQVVTRLGETVHTDETRIGGRTRGRRVGRLRYGEHRV